MAFPRAHLLLTPIGDAWSATEQWTFGLRVDRVALPSDGEMTTLLTHYEAYLKNANCSFVTQVRMLGLKAAPIGTDGRYPPDAGAKERLYATPITGISVFAGTLPQSTAAVSLWTAKSRGRGSKGRFYPPVQVHNIDATGRLPGSIPGVYAAAAKSLIQNIQTTLGAPVVVGSALASTLLPVTAVAVGRVVDTQRRRRSSLAEEHVSAAVTPLA